MLKREWERLGRKYSVLCKGEKELMVPFYLSHLLEAFALFSLCQYVGLLIGWLRKQQEGL